jgi:hypothetical protein
MAERPDIIFDGSAPLIVVLHAATSIVLIGAVTHHLVIAIGYWRGRYNVRLGRIYAATIAVTYTITFILGLLAYPTFRYHVRALYFDRYERWASNLFDMKENFAAVGLPLVLALFALSRVMQPKEEPTVVRGYVVFSILLALIVWFAVFSGLVITMERGV